MITDSLRGTCIAYGPACTHQTESFLSTIGEQVDVRNPPLRTEESLSEPSIVAVVDDDRAVRRALGALLESFDYAVRTYGSGEEFLQSGQMSSTDCLLLDMRMSGMSGPELQAHLRRLGIAIPIVFMTAHAEASVRLRAMNAGAVECLQKPFTDEVLLDAIRRALDARS